MDLEFLAQTDAASIRFEKAKRQLEAAKIEMDAAKQNYDDLLSKADEHGFSRAKLKKITDDRVNALFEAGMVELEVPVFQASAPTSKPERPKRPKKKADEPKSEEVHVQDFETDDSFEETPGPAIEL